MPTLHRRQATLLLAALAFSAAATAQGRFPDRPITFVVPFAAGSATDQLARALGHSLTEQTRQQVLIENRAGASGMLAAQAAARAPADGHTVLITTNTTHAANEHLFRRLPYDPVRDFAPVTGLGKGGQVLVVRADAPFRTVADLVTRARQQPGKLSFGSGSSSSRVAGEMLKQLAGIDVLHVPYRSNPLALTDLIGGHIDFMVTDTATGLPLVRAGQLRALGVSTSRRIPLLPEVPTIDEAGVRGYDMGFWFAAYVPTGTPQPVVVRLNELLHSAVRSATARSFFDTSGVEAWVSSPDELARFQVAETQKWGRVIRAAGIEPE